MTITLTGEETRQLELLAEAGKKERTISAPRPRGGLQRLVDAGYVTDRAISMDAVLYVITDLGRKALADVKR
jgi:DNA-binding PadR family transcriptional regulator